MTATQRRLYLLVFVILFFITAPVLVLFTKGYRFDTVNNIFVYSGSVTIKSVPRDIEVLVDGKKKRKSQLNVINGSYTINGIRPGKHTVTCKKEGYTTWTKEIDVHSGISTEFWNVLLLPTSNFEEKSFTTENIEQFFLSPRNNNEVVIFSKQDDKSIVSLLNTQDDSLEKIYETSEFSFLAQNKKENVEWSSDNKRILIPFLTKDGEKTFVIAKVDEENLEDLVILDNLFEEKVEKEEISKNAKTIAPIEEVSASSMAPKPNSNTTSKEVVSNTKTKEALTTKKKKDSSKEATIEDMEKTQFKQVRWMFNKNDELVVLTKDHHLFYINIEKPEEKILLDKQVGGFDFAGNRIYYFHLVDNSIWEVKNTDIENKKQIASLLTITDKDSFVKMVTYDQYRIALITQDHKLFLFNYEKEECEVSIKELSNNTQDIQFSDDGKKLLYWSDNEIWYTMLRDWEVQPTREKGEKFLITRSSIPIKNVQWIEDYENIFFTMGNTIKSSGIDVRDHIAIINVQKSSQEIIDRDVLYDKNTQLLYSKKPVEGKNEFKLYNVKLIDRGNFLGL